MARPRIITLDGKAYECKSVLNAYREQARAMAAPEQPALFEMHEDRRPPGERTAAERYLSPSLFSVLEP